MTIKQPLEIIPLDPDRLTIRCSRHGGVTRLAAHKRHFTDIVACRHIVQDDVMIADLLAHQHRAAADQMQTVAILTLVEQNPALGPGVDRRRRCNIIDTRAIKARRQMRLDRTRNRLAIHAFADRGNACAHGNHPAARDLKQQRPANRRDGCRTPTPGNQSHFPEEGTLFENDARLGRVLIVQMHPDRALDHHEETVGVVIAPEDDLAIRQAVDVGFEHGITQHQRIQLGKDRHPVSHGLEETLDAPSGDTNQLFAQQRRICGFNVSPHDVLDHLVALIQRLLDQGKTAQGADDIKPRDI